MSGPTTGERRLAGWRVLVPRPAERSGDLVDGLTVAGAVADVAPLIGISPPEDPGELDRGVRGLADGAYRWVVFTSVNAVDAMVSRAAALGRPPLGAGTRVAAVGPSTASALRDAGLPVDLTPPASGSAAALATVFPPADGPSSVLLPRSDLAPALLPDALAGLGYRVDPVVAYRTAVRPPGPAVADRLAAGDFDAVLFTSPSTVHAVAGLPIADRTALGAIGEPTRAAAVAAGRQIAFVAIEPTARGYVDALIEHARSHQEA